MDRKEETKLVKNALINAGFDNNSLRVKHGTGTAWGWLKVYADLHHLPDCTCKVYADMPRETCQECGVFWRETYNKIENITIQASGRNKYQSECINIHLGFID
jgi:hypothetical protein